MTVFKFNNHTVTFVNVLCSMSDNKQFRVSVFKNGSGHSGGKVVLVSEDESLEAFLAKAAQKLGITANESSFKDWKVFTKEGSQVEDCAELCPNDVLYISMGEDFVHPDASTSGTTSSSDSSTQGNNNNSTTTSGTTGVGIPTPAAVT